MKERNGFKIGKLIKKKANISFSFLNKENNREEEDYLRGRSVRRLLLCYVLLCDCL